MMTPANDQIARVNNETPRRDAIRTMSLTGAALLGLASLSDTDTVQGKRTQRPVNTEKKKRKRKKRCTCQKIGLTSAESAPFTVGANQGETRQATCPAGFIAISGGLEGVNAVTAPCMIRESHVDPSGSAWIVNVFCTEATNTPLIVGAICFSEESFQLQ